MATNLLNLLPIFKGILLFDIEKKVNQFLTVHRKCSIVSTSSTRHFHIITVTGHGMIKLTIIYRLVHCLVNHILSHSDIEVQRLVQSSNRNLTKPKSMSIIRFFNCFDKADLAWLISVYSLFGDWTIVAHIHQTGTWLSFIIDTF